MWYPNINWKIPYILNSYGIAIDNQLKSYIFPTPTFFRILCSKGTLKAFLTRIVSHWIDIFISKGTLKAFHWTPFICYLTTSSPTSQLHLLPPEADAIFFPRSSHTSAAAPRASTLPRWARVLPKLCAVLARSPNETLARPR